MTKSFDRVAHEYDATRGGDQRGARFASEIEALFAAPGPALEIGVGTGVVAKGLMDLGRPVFGVDVSPKMLERARERIGARVAAGDASRLPVASGSFDHAYSVWVLHLVDIGSVLGEVLRVLRPGGRYIVTGAGAEERSDPIGVHRVELARVIGWKDRDHPDEVTATALGAGFRLVARHEGKSRSFDERPREIADQIERRSYSMLWDVDDETWERAVIPIVERLRAMPDEPIRRVSRPLFLIFERPAS